MKVKITDNGAFITLSRRNLLSLLAKLDGHPTPSAATLERVDGDAFVSVKAEEDDVHYGERRPGEMHRETEAAIKHSEKSAAELIADHNREARAANVRNNNKRSV